QEEFGTLASLQHPRIAAAYDFGYSGDRSLPYYTREYIEGTSLPAGPPGSMDPLSFLKPILDLLEALEYLHRHGILHLDIHAGNLIVAREASRGSVLIDFGFFHSRAPLEPTLPRRLPAPLPPDILGKVPVSPATDIFFAGRLLLYRLCGEACNEARLPREIPGWGARVTLELERICAKALDADPARRFPSASEFHHALSRALGGVLHPARPQAPSAPILGRKLELARIEEALHAAAAGESAVLCLKGPSGIGKTRLLAQARMTAQLLGLETAEVRFFPDAGPGSTLAGVLRGSGAPGPGRRKPSWVEALDAAHGGTPEERARRAAKRYFDEEGRSMAVLLDDLDQADRSSRILAEALLDEASSRRSGRQAGRGLCIIGSTSSTVPPGVRPREVVALRPLRPPDARRLLRAFVQPLVVPD
ncbi:MAG: serine/threonine protein kinase, partial [Candidatus Methylomirabilales bacterium]